MKSVVAFRIFVPALAAALVFAASPQGASAQDRKPRDRSRQRGQGGQGGGRQGASSSELQELRSLEERAKARSWDHEAQFLHQAHLNVFQKNGWNSESDQFALNLIQQITNIAPWDNKERENAFLNGVQVRMNLTEDQRSLVAAEMRRESMQLAMKHFPAMFPVVTEIIKTRLDEKPFTPEQVQRWSQNLRPVMDDALAALQRTSKKLESTMNDDQKARLKADMDALVRRHQDVEKMVDRWKSGQWNPTEWGLDQDPLHQQAMAEWRAKEAHRNALAEAAMVRHDGPPAIEASNESDWRKYVRWFITHYGCDDKQSGQAESILKSSEKEAFDYLGSRSKEFDRAEAALAAADSDAKRAHANAELTRLRAPIADMFERMKKRLDSQVLTTEQRKRMPKAPSAASSETARK